MAGWANISLAKNSLVGSLQWPYKMEKTIRLRRILKTLSLLTNADGSATIFARKLI